MELDGGGVVVNTISAKWAKGSGGYAGATEHNNLTVQTFSTPAIGHMRHDDVASTITKNTGGGGETQNPLFVVDVSPCLSMGAHTAAPGSNGQDAAQWASITHQHTGRPRRLTPLECERLMGWPDQWTATGTRENGATYALSDSARYRLCGNGVGAPVAEWIGRRLVQYDAALRQEDAA